MTQGKQHTSHDEQFCELYRKLKFWWGMRHIEEGAFLLGIHILAKMAKMDSLEIAGTWEEFTNEVVVRGGDVLAGPVDYQSFMYLGALQQLHNVVGLFSAINQQGIEDAIAEAKEPSNKFISHHFTKNPETDPNLVAGSTPMLFVYVPWAGYDVDATWQDFQQGGRAVILPSWISSGVKSKG